MIVKTTKQEEWSRIIITDENSYRFEIVLKKKDADIIQKECLIFRQSYEKRIIRRGRSKNDC